MLHQSSQRYIIVNCVPIHIRVSRRSAVVYVAHLMYNLFYITLFCRQFILAKKGGNEKQMSSVLLPISTIAGDMPPEERLFVFVGHGKKLLVHDDIFWG